MIVAEHSSGLHSVEPAALKAALVKQLADEPDFLSLTEMMGEARAAVLLEFPAYAVARGGGPDGQDECAALVKRETLPEFAFDVELLSEMPIPRRSGKLCTALVIRVGDSAIGPAHTRIIIHMPSGVEDALRDGVGGVEGAQARVYRDAIGGLKRLVASIDGPLVITGDWNLDLRKAWVREYLKRHFPEFVPTWRAGNPPELGTHGSRVIDFSLVRGFSVTAAHVVPDFGASDHRAIRETHKEIAVTPDPYARNVFHGKPLDNASIACLKLAEAKLGYELTILQGIGGASASAGTHAEGRAVDLAPFDHERKLRVLKDLGWAAWYRPRIEGLWGAHIHAILIFENRTNSRGLADVGFRQIAAFDAGRDGLKSNRADPTYRPSPKAVFTLPEYVATCVPVAAAVPKKPNRFDLIWETANAIVEDAPNDADTELDDKDDIARKIRTLAALKANQH